MKCKTPWLVVLLSGFVALAEASVVGSLEGEVEVEQGTLSYTLPFNVPKGRNGNKPDLALVYRKGQGNGVLGLGFSVSGLSAITRCAASKEIDGYRGTVLFKNSDKYCLDGTRLVAVKGAAGQNATEYRLSNNNFTKVISNGRKGYGPRSWTVYSKDGFIYRYGETAHSTQSPANKTEISSWSLTSRQDRFGNKIKYGYINIYGNNLLSAINYAPYMVKFSYENRTDNFISYQLGKRLILNKRLSKITLTGNRRPLHHYEFDYESSSGFSRLNSVKICDSNRRCAPATTFDWDKTGSKATGTVDFTKIPVNMMTYRVTDLNLDGKQDVCYLSASKGLVCAYGNDRGGLSNVKVWSSQLANEKWHDADVYNTLVFKDLN